MEKLTNHTALPAADMLFAQIVQRYQVFFAQLPPSLRDLPRAYPTFFGKIIESTLDTELPVPASLSFPFLFWHLFDNLEDNIYLDIADAGGFLFLSSVLLDHITDQEVPQPRDFEAFQEALWAHGLEGYRKIFPRDSVFWRQFDRMISTYKKGLADERASQEKLGILQKKKFQNIAASKILPATSTLYALTLAAGKDHILADLEESLRHYAIALQYADDLQDWKSDFENKHLTYSLLSILPQSRWGDIGHEDSESLGEIVNSKQILLELWRQCRSHYDASLAAVHHLLCPGWTDLVFEQRSIAIRQQRQASARYLLAHLKSLQSPQPTTITKENEEKPLSTPAKNVLSSNYINNAIEAIMAHQYPDGSWHEFDLPNAGSSDTWITAHVGLKLACLPAVYQSPELRKALNNAAAFLAANWHHGWGYNHLIPVDADSTAHAILFFQALGLSPPDSTLEALLQFQQQDNGFATYNGLRSKNIHESWCISQPDITAMVVWSLALYKSKPVVSQALERAQKQMKQIAIGRNQWPAFWWKLNWYTASTWYQACQALGEKPQLPDLPSAESLDHHCESNLDRAHLLELARFSSDRRLGNTLVEHLVDDQAANGFWPPEPALCQPPAGIERSWEMPVRETLYQENHGIYSTATILLALAKWDHNRKSRANHSASMT